METAELTRRVNEIPFWYHRIELPGGVITPGTHPVNPEIYRLPESLEGKRILDVGAADGYWTFEALKRGAKEVVAIDDFSDSFGLPDDARPAPWAAFDLAREALGFSEDRCQRRDMSIYELSPDEFGTFDLILCFGVLDQLRHPLLGLDLLYAVCSEGGEGEKGGQIHLETAILDDFSPYQGGFGRGYPGNHIVMEFYPTNQYAGNSTIQWSPTVKCLLGLLYAAGFRENGVWKRSDQPASIEDCRAFALGHKRTARGGGAASGSEGAQAGATA